MDWMMELVMRMVKVVEMLWEQGQMSFMVRKEKKQNLFKQARQQSLLRLPSNYLLLLQLHSVRLSKDIMAIDLHKGI